MFSVDYNRTSLYLLRLIGVPLSYVPNEINVLLFFSENFFELRVFQWLNTFSIFLQGNDFNWSIYFNFDLFISIFLQGNDFNWSIYFNDLHLPEYDMLQYASSVQLGFGNFELTHVDGGLFKLSPTAKFEGKLM